MRVGTLDQVKALFVARSVRTLFVKALSEKQDNEKNQIFLGTDVAGVLASFPGEVSLRPPSESISKRASRPGTPIQELALNFCWLDAEGNEYRAPKARIIGYFQYPEARLSGFLAGADWAPEAIRRDQQGRFGQRYLFMGWDPAGTVYALLINALEDPLAGSFPELPASGVSNVLKTLTTGEDTGLSDAEQLEHKLLTIIDRGWHASVRNKGGTIIPFKGNQGAGFTLEALLGVQTNSLKEPDIHGHEVKSFRGDKISLMTPVADQGPEGDLTFREFMAAHGHPAKKNDGSLRFTGSARAGKISAATGRTIRVKGYDTETGEFDTDPDKIRIELVQAAEDKLIAAWSLQRLAGGWARKHAFAVYVPAEAHKTKNQYRFNRPLFFCAGTSIWKFMEAVATGLVYYDPAHVIYEDGRAKQRPQWRISTSRLQEKLARLYDTVRPVS